MAKGNHSSQLPVSQPRWLLALLGGFWLLMAVGMVVAGAVELSRGTVAIILVILPFCALGMVAGIYLLRLAATVVSLSPEGVRVCRLGKLKLVIPADRLNIYLAGVQTGNRMGIYLCPYTIEELAAFREAKLQKGAITRGELVFRKRVAEWQSVFANEYMKRWAVNIFRDPVGKGVVALGYTPEMEFALKRCFPQIACQQLVDLPPQQIQLPGKPEVEQFGRKGGESSVWVLVVIMAVILLPWFAVFPAVEWGLPLWPAVGGTFLVVLVLGILLCPKSQVFRPTPEGIHLEGKKPRLIPAESIRTIARVGIRYRFWISYYLVVTELTVEELAQRQAKKLRHHAAGRRMLELYAQTPDGKETLARRYCSRRVLWRGNTDPELLVAVYTPEREKLLRELYPHAQWLDWPEGMY